MRLVLLVLLASCAKQQGAYEVPAAAAPSADAAAGLKSEADGLWEQRGDKAQLQAALARYEQAYAADPTDREVAYRLLRGWYFLGDGHETEMDAKLSAWGTAIDWGKRCLALNKEFTELLAKGDETEASAARAFTADDVPCLYWTSSALGKWAKSSGIATTLKHLPAVKAYMTRVGELDPTYYYGGPDRYWGAYFAAIPSFAGQDLDKSRSHFDKALAAHPDFLGTHVLLAEQWAVKKQDRATFEKELRWVLEQPVDAIPEIRAEAEAERRKAEDLLARADEFFAN